MNDRYHLAQVNIARMLAPIDAPTMQTFVELLDEVNALADASPGFVWRLQGGEGNATYLRPYDDDRILFNMSVWASIDALRAYAYGGAHAAVMRRRREWFTLLEQPSVALWWIPAGHVPSVDGAVRRLDYLQRHGPTGYAFTFRTTFEPSADCLELPGDAKARPCSAT
jgi:hypothetical protein